MSHDIVDIDMGVALDRATDRAVDANLEFGQATRIVETAAHAAGDFAHVDAPVGHLGEDREFVAPGPGEKISGPQV